MRPVGQRGGGLFRDHVTGTLLPYVSDGPPWRAARPGGLWCCDQEDRSTVLSVRQHTPAGVEEVASVLHRKLPHEGLAAVACPPGRARRRRRSAGPARRPPPLLAPVQVPRVQLDPVLQWHAVRPAEEVRHPVLLAEVQDEGVAPPPVTFRRRHSVTLLEGSADQNHLLKVYRRSRPASQRRDGKRCLADHHPPHRERRRGHRLTLASPGSDPREGGPEHGRSARDGVVVTSAAPTTPC